MGVVAADPDDLLLAIEGLDIDDQAAGHDADPAEGLLAAHYHEWCIDIAIITSVSTGDLGRS